MLGWPCAHAPGAGGVALHVVAEVFFGEVAHLAQGFEIRCRGCEASPAAVGGVHDEAAVDGFGDGAHEGDAEFFGDPANRFALPALTVKKTHHPRVPLAVREGRFIHSTYIFGCGHVWGLGFGGSWLGGTAGLKRNKASGGRHLEGNALR